MRMYQGWQKRLWRWFKTILSYIVERLKAICTHFVAYANGKKKKELQSKYYGKIEEISLYNFAMCCEGDLSYLCKDKRAKRNKKQELQIFGQLALEYNNALNVSIRDFAKEIRYYVLLSRLAIIGSLIGNCAITVKEKKILKSIGITIGDNQLNNIYLLHGKYKQLERELQALKNDISEKEKQRVEKSSLANFSKVLTAISTYYKVFLNIKEISVFDYCNYYNQYIAEVKEIEKQRNKIKNGKGKN